MKQLTMRQAAMMLSFSMVSVKFLIFPALISKFAGINSYISTAGSFIIDLLMVAMVVYVLKKFPNKTFKEIMSETYGVVVTKMVFSVLFIYLFIKTILIMKEAHTYFQDTLFDDFSLTMFILPIVASSLFMASKNLKALGRSVELIFFIVLIGVLLMIIIPIEKIDVFSIFPILEDGLGPIGETIGKTAFSFGDHLLLALMIGKVRMGKDKTSKIFYYALATAIFVVVLNIVFISLFGNTGINQQLAVSDVPLHSTNPTTIGRLDWLSIILWIVTLLMQSGIFMFFTVDTFIEVTTLNKNLSVLIVSVMITIILYVLSLNLAKMIEFFLSPVFCTLVIIFQVIVPVILFFAALVNGRRKKDAKVEENI